MTQEFTNLKISDIAYKDHSRIDPSDNKDKTFNLYSFSAHDEGKEPDIKMGSEIGSSKYEVPDNCVLVTKLNPRIQRVWKINQSGDNAICSTEFVVLKPKDEEMLDYLYMILSSDGFFNKMERITGGTSGSHQRVSQSDILEYEFTAPSAKDGRKRTSDLINNIDRKIELNCELAELLEETAHAIYESKFSNVDEEVSMEELGEFINGYSFDQDKVSDEGRPIIKIKELNNQISDSSDRYPDEYVDEDIEDHSLESGDILLSWSATLDVFLWKQNRGLLNQHIFRVDPNNEYSKVFIYHSIKPKMNEIRGRASGTTTVHINRDDLGEIYVPVGEDDLVEEFTTQTKDMFNKIISLKKENQRLAELRDYLLPQLLSGEVVIRDDKEESKSDGTSSD